MVRVLITHHHPDHALGNQAFADVPIAALPGTTELLRQQGDAMAENMYRLVGDWMRGTEVLLPTEAVTPGTLTIGGHPLRLLALRGHRGGPGDPRRAHRRALRRRPSVLPARPHHPNSPGLDTWLADLDQLQALPWKLLVPGHGPVARDDAIFAQMRDYLGWLDGLLRDGAKRGAEMNELIRAPIPERFAGISLTRYELVRSVSHLYPRYERERLPLAE